jgi:D-galactarolactone cycloisomerase
LLGGSSGRVETYASGLLWQDNLSILAVEAERHAEAGFRLMKMRLGHGVEYDREAVAVVCGAVKDRARVAVDGTHRYSPDGARSLCRHLSEHDVAWFEEPFPPEDIEAYAALRSAVEVPIAAGENEFGVQGFRELLRAGAIDVAQPDASRTGGITECFRIARLAGEEGVTLATHGWSDAIAVMANAHVAAASPAGSLVELDRTGTPLIDALLDDPLRIENGVLELTDRPGLGVSLNEEVLARLVLPRGSPLPEGNYADLVFGSQPYETVPPYAAREYGGVSR